MTILPPAVSQLSNASSCERESSRKDWSYKITCETPSRARGSDGSSLNESSDQTIGHHRSQRYREGTGFAHQQHDRRRREVAPQIQLAGGASSGAVKRDQQRAADEIGIDGELNGFPRMAGNETDPCDNEADKERRSWRRRLSKPELPKSLPRDGRSCDFEFQRERTSELKYAVKADARFDRYFGVTEKKRKEDSIESSL